jgi:hypothetical protein
MADADVQSRELLNMKQKYNAIASDLFNLPLRQNLFANIREQRSLILYCDMKFERAREAGQ